MADVPSGGWREVYERLHCPLPTDDPDDLPGEVDQDDETAVPEPSSENRG